MKTARERLNESNPFSTRFVQPGAIEYLFDERADGAMLVRKFEQNGRRGAIVGPHGSGKSSLLATLLPEFERAGYRPLLMRLHDGQRQLLGGFEKSDSYTLWVVDGYEQLNYWSRWKLAWLSLREGAGLLVTSHRRVGLPTLYETRTSPELAAAVVARLLSPDVTTITPHDIADVFSRHGGDLRETLFDLYDRYERFRAAEPNAVAARK